MFNLDKILSDLGISHEEMASKIGVSCDYLNSVISSNDEELKDELYCQFIQVKSNEELLPELLEFYQEFSEDYVELEAFIREALFYQESNIPRKMINIVEWLVKLADDIEIIRKGKDGLKIFFLVVCIEALYVLANPEDGQNKLTMVIDFFENHISEEDREHIQKNIKRSLADARFNVFRQDHESHEELERRTGEKIDWSFNTDVSIEIFAKMINEVRNMFAHEGNFWDFHFCDGDIPLMNFLTLAETREQFKLRQRQERIYTITLTYADFRRICVKGYMGFIRKYLAISTV
ncbi:MAG: hypothetical protein APF81_09050 [Desulfosporosinus sp. BRH_c37]|nr:MAG: hypothetical protein APF81_09050 [Desulfosporosinus sp. BRH_c37]